LCRLATSSGDGTVGIYALPVHELLAVALRRHTRPDTSRVPDLSREPELPHQPLRTRLRPTPQGDGAVELGRLKNRYHSDKFVIWPQLDR
jgi:hypothetical protein